MGVVQGRKALIWIYLYYIPTRFPFFKITYKKSYADSSSESIHRETFITNMNHIAAHNKLYEAGESTYELGMNAYGDLSMDELAKRKGYKSSDKVGSFLEIMQSKCDMFNGEIPKSVDWRNKGAVTPVKDQGSCGSCWAFSATGAVEGQHFLKTKKLVSLSEQNLLDCGSYQPDSCGGSEMILAFSYIILNQGINTEESYPYESAELICRYDPKNVGATVAGLCMVPEGNETMLMHAIANEGPIAVAIDTTGDFNFYKSGVYFNRNCNTDKDKLDHAVLAVGYGTDGNNQDYYIIKNSWSPNWGDNGYIKMARNRKNNCGIATKATYPIV